MRPKRSPGARLVMPEHGQPVPLRVYRTDDLLVLAAPMPGLEPADIRVSITGDRVTIHGEERGPHQRKRDLVLAEWAIGSYHREVTLPQAVNGALTNATYRRHARRAGGAHRPEYPANDDHGAPPRSTAGRRRWTGHGGQRPVMGQELHELAV